MLETSMQSSKSWLEISERRLRRNYRTLVQYAQAGASRASVLAVIKAGAYGHGAELCAPVLASAGAPWLGVTDADEGIRVRQALRRALPPGDKEPEILVMCGLLPDEAEAILEHQLTPVVWSPDQLAWLAEAAAPGRPSPVHVEIDTGMARQGVRPGAQLEKFLDFLAATPQLRPSGVLTHFASAEQAGAAYTVLQRSHFENALAQIYATGTRPDWIHVGNTSTIDEARSLPWLQQLADRYQASPLVRSGLALYGYSLPLEGATSSLRDRLEPVSTWKTRIIAISDLAPGSTVGYNATYTASRAMRLALLPVGYADGLRRELSSTSLRSGGWAMVGGQRATIVGRISMNLTSVDITDNPAARVGDVTILLGDCASADDHARLADTIPYDILCGIRSQPKLVP